MLWTSGAPMQWRWKGRQSWQKLERNNTDLEEWIKAMRVPAIWEFRKMPSGLD